MEQRTRIRITEEWIKKEEDGYIIYRCPESGNAAERVPLGFDWTYPSAADVMGWKGLRLRLAVTESCGGKESRPVSVTVKAGFQNGLTLYRDLVSAGSGEPELFAELGSFDIERANETIWRELVSIGVRVCASESAGDGMSERAVIRELTLVKGTVICVESGRRGLSADAGESVCYEARVFNTSDRVQIAAASQIIEGWESLSAEITPKTAEIKPGSVQNFLIRVTVHENMPPGSHEKTRIRFVPNGNDAAGEELCFYTLRRLAHPYLYHTREEWKTVARQIGQYEKFRPEYETMKRDADSWEVKPPLPLHERDYCYDTRQEHYLMCSAYLYSITGERGYAKKAADFLRYFSNREYGYPVKKKGCSQSYVQEGHFFQHLALAYDMIYDSGTLKAENREGIEACFIIYMDILDRHIRSGHITNWVLSEVTGAVYCAMAMQDFERAERFVYGPGGTVEQLKKGTFSDGWWYEGSVGYNIWVSSMFLHTAHALRRFGVNIADTWFEIPYNKQVSGSHPGREISVRHGMYNEKWGGTGKSYIRIKDLFDAPLKFLDYRGVLFGVNDSDEKKIEGVHMGSTYDLAYRYYRDPAYLPVIRRADVCDPIFGIPVLPEGSQEAEKQYGTGNAYSDNIGIVMLRSRSRIEGDGSARERIQAVLRYGSHGYAHGHFDRTELLSLMRYGRSFYNPEHVWWGYGHFMYKFYVQNSNTKNMVVVDGKTQIPADAERILFYSGSLFQAAAVNTLTRWAWPPYGGMIYEPGETLQQRCARNASDLDRYDAAPYGEMTEFTEEIDQTRAMAVFDDYVLLFDRVSGEKEHMYEGLMQIKGFLGLEAENGEENPEPVYLYHTGQKSTDPRSDAQFITNCDWYQARGGTNAHFSMKFGEGADLRGTRMGYCEPGALKLDVHTAWPKQTTICIGNAAEDLGIRIPYRLEILADGQEIGSYSANAWLLGARRYEADVTRASELTLKITNLPLYSEQNYPRRSPQGLFLAEAEIELTDGSVCTLAQLGAVFENIDPGFGTGRDYENGEVLIAGNFYPDAVPVSPADHDKPGIIRIPLAGRNAALFTGFIGATNFPGDHSQRRKTFGAACTGKTAGFITLLEPFEAEPAVKSVWAPDENTVVVTLRDGRVQEITIEGMEEKRIAITAREYRDGVLIREERGSETKKDN